MVYVHRLSSRVNDNLNDHISYCDYIHYSCDSNSTWKSYGGNPCAAGATVVSDDYTYE